MPNYNELKKLDLETLKQLKDGIGPSDECICNILAPPDAERKRSMGASIKKAFASLGGGKRGRTMKMDNQGVAGIKSIDIPLTYTKGGKGIYTTKEEIKGNSSCKNCACEDQKFVLKHSYANIRIISPDISSICPCPTDCLPEKSKLQNNIKVTIENVHLDPDYVDSEYSITDPLDITQMPMEPILERRSISELIEAEYDNDEYDYSQTSKWSLEED